MFLNVKRNVERVKFVSNGQSRVSPTTKTLTVRVAERERGDFSLSAM